MMLINDLDMVLGPVVSFTVASAGVMVLRGPATKVGLVDAPGQRKHHLAPVPLTGGAAIMLGFALGFALLEPRAAPYATLFLGMGVMLVMGLLDDILDLPARVRLAVQLAVAAIAVVWGGVLVENLGNLFGFGDVGLGPLAMVFTLTCIVFMTNAVNMMDGMDGLAGGVTTVMFTAMAAAGAVAGVRFGAIVICLLLAAAVAGFLVFNLRVPWRPQARAFMGDGGSMVLGFAAAWIGIHLAGSTDSSIPAVVMAWILALPAVDMLSLFFRRAMRGRSPLSPDRTHLHHFLQRCGYSVNQALAILVGMELLFAVVGVGGWALGVPESLLGWGVLGVFLAHFVLIANGRAVMRHCRARRAVVETARDVAANPVRTEWE